MGIFIQLLINGLIAGAIYALIASGFSLIYATNKFVHFAHGTVIVASGYFLYFLFNLVGINFWLSIILAIAFGAFFGWVLNKVVYERLRAIKAGPNILLIASIGLLILIESLILIIFGADVKTIGFIKIVKGLEIFGAIITPLQIIIIIISIVLLVVLLRLMKKTKIGKALRAVSSGKELVEILGISSKKLYSYSFIIGSAIAGIAGILIALEQNLEPFMGSTLMIKGFTGAVIGGITSVPGAILGSFLLGIVENFGIWWLPSGYKDAISFMLLFLFLLFRPNGILGINKGWKKN
jgi:branched-chain amino acid transport system permease protein